MPHYRRKNATLIIVGTPLYVSVNQSFKVQDNAIHIPPSSDKIPDKSGLRQAESRPRLVGILPDRIGTGGTEQAEFKATKVLLIGIRRFLLQLLDYFSNNDSSTSALIMASLNVISADFSPLSTKTVWNATITPETSR